MTKKIDVHNIPIHYFEYSKKLGYDKIMCINDEKLYEKILSLFFLQ